MLKPLPKVLGVCFLINLLDGYDVQALGLAIPGISKEWGVAPDALRWAALTSLAGMALGAFSAGSLVRRLGERRLLLILLAAAALSCLGCGLAQSVRALAGFRAVTGFAVGGILPIVLSTVAASVAAEHRARWVAFMASAIGAGTIVASFSAPALMNAYGWRGVFVAGAVVPIVLLPLIWRWFPAMVVRPEKESASVQSATVARGALLAQLFTPQLKVRTTLLWITIACSLFVVYSLLSWLPALLVESGWRASQAARAAGWLGVGGMVGGLLLAWLVDQGKRRAALAVGYALSVVVLVAISTGVWSIPVWMLLLTGVGLFTVGSQLAVGALTATLYPAPLRVTAIGWGGGMGRIGAWIGPMCVAEFMQWGWTVREVMGALAIPQLICLACMVLLPTKTEDS
jgi:MFS transporter, AAHS family, 4-hydroxybenzoate transporter